MYAALDVCRLVSRKYTVSRVLVLVVGGILVVHGHRERPSQTDVRREPNGGRGMNSLEERGCCTGGTDLRACASALREYY